MKSTSPTTAAITVTVNMHNRERRVVTVPAGTYQMVAVTGSQLDAPQIAEDPTTESAKITVHGEFSAPGIASGKAIGAGEKYLTLPGTLACSTHSVTADFTKAAGKKKKGTKPRIRRAKFLVNGEKVQVVKKPNKKTLVTLTGLDDTDEVDVEAVLVLQDGHKTSVRRSYLPCS